MEKKFRHLSFKKRLSTMLYVDFRRMFTMPLIYIMVGICIVMPILILVMTTIMDGSVSVDPVTGAETIMEGFDNTWQIIASASGDTSAMGMSMLSMCNINMLYFFIAVLVCIFVADDFRSGFSKNLFTVRADKKDYIFSKTLVCTFGSILMLLGFFIGTMLGGAISGLSFDLGEAGIMGLVMCMISKLLLTGTFVPIYLIVSAAAKRKLWLSLTGSFGAGMLLFMMIPMLTPLDSTMINVIICLAGGMLFSVSLAFASRTILEKTSLV